MNTNKFYNNWFKKLQNKEYEPLLKAAQSHISLCLSKEDIAGKKILDAGCGIGLNSISLALNGADSVTGIDICKPAIEIANRMAENYNVSKKINFQKMSMTDIEFEDESFDTVFAWGTICHTSDPLKSLAHLQRVTKKGGTIFINFYKWHWSTPIHSTIRKIMSFLPAFTHESISKILYYLMWPIFKIKKPGGRINNPWIDIGDWFFVPIRYHYKPEDIIYNFTKNRFAIVDFLPKNARFEFSSQFYIKAKRIA